MTFRWRAAWHWLYVEMRFIWLPVLVLVLTLVVCFQIRAGPEDAVRLAGALLQVAGLSAVAIGLHQVRQLFDRPGVWAHLATLLRRVPTFFRPAKQAVAVGTITGSGGFFGAGSIDIKPNQDASLEERLAWLEGQVQRVQEEAREAHKHLQQEVRSLRKRVHQERKESAKSLREIREQLEGLGVGGLYLEATGLVWLFAGVILGTLPAEIGQLLSRLAGVG